MALIEQEVSAEPEIEIPEEVREIYKLWRPTPLSARGGSSGRSIPRRTSTTSTRASRPAGSHKPNTAVAQAYYNKQEGMRKLATETGAGQWGSALALACRLFGLECEVFMVGVSYDQKPYRRAMMETWGGDGPPEPVRAHRGRPLAGRALDRAASGSRSPRRSRSRPAATTPITRSARCSTTSACTRR